MHKVVPVNAVFIPDTAQLVFQGEIFGIYHWVQDLYDGSKATFEMLRRPDTVVVIGVEKSNLVLVQDEQPHRGSLLQFPSGRVEPTDKSWKHAAQREMREETGLEFEDWRLVSVVQPVRKVEWFVAYYIAYGVVSHNKPNNDSGEKISIVREDLMTYKKKMAQDYADNSHINHIFNAFGSLDALVAELPSFVGITVDR